MAPLNTKNAVGIIILDGSRECLRAILQVRPEKNFERVGRESWAGACQVTAHGKLLEGGEDFLTALWREIEEELGPQIVPTLQELHAAGKMVELVNEVTPDGRHIITYGVVLRTSTSVSAVIYGPHSGPNGSGFRMIKKEEVGKIIDLQTTYKKETGVTDEGVTAMFKNDAEAVRLAFQKLG